MTRGRPGRSTAQLLADFGHDLPAKPEPARPVKDHSLFAGVRGVPDAAASESPVAAGAPPARRCRSGG